jgi:large subunit ribosomal protein L6e
LLVQYLTPDCISVARHPKHNKQIEAIFIPGPLKLNGCPLRRINQRYLLATSTRLDISGVKVEDRINDDYFRDRFYKTRISANKT